MANPIKTWFFELIEDAIGSKAMKQFKEEEEGKNETAAKHSILKARGGDQRRKAEIIFLDK